MRYLFLLIFFFGCIYYNVYYNAKKYYNDAMKTKPPNEALLDKCIEKCAKIIEYQPNSKHVPDAIYLMGMCFLAKGEFNNARRKFQELMTFYPNHKFADSSRIFLITSYIKEGNWVEPKYLISRLSDEELKSKLLIELNFFSHEYDTAIALSKEFIKKFKQSKFLKEVLIFLSQSYDSIKEYNLALEYYKKLLPYYDDKFDINFTIGEHLLLLGNIDAALDKFFELRKMAQLKEKEEVEIKISQCYLLLNKIDEAINILNGLENSPKAWYLLGKIYEKRKDNLDSALKYYNLAKNTSDKEVSDSAKKMASRISKLFEYTKEVEDTTQIEERAKNKFLLAELYYFEFNDVENAIKVCNELIENFKSTDYGKKAYFLLAWIERNDKKNVMRAIEIYKEIEKEYPGDFYAKKAREEVEKLKNEGYKE